MNHMIKKFNDFLEDIKENDPVVEAIQSAFNSIFESTEDAVRTLKKAVPKKDEIDASPTDEFIDELEEKGDIEPEPEINPAGDVSDEELEKILQ